MTNIWTMDVNLKLVSLIQEFDAYNRTDKAWKTNKKKWTSVLINLQAAFPNEVFRGGWKAILNQFIKIKDEFLAKFGLTDEDNETLASLKQNDSDEDNFPILNITSEFLETNDMSSEPKLLVEEHTAEKESVTSTITNLLIITK